MLKKQSFLDYSSDHTRNVKLRLEVFITLVLGFSVIYQKIVR